MTQTADLLYKMAEFFRSEEFFEKGEDARLELSPDDVRCMNRIIKACGNAISRQAVKDLLVSNGIYGYGTLIDKLPPVTSKDVPDIIVGKCDDAISREDAIKQCGFGMTSLLIADCLRKLPPVNPQESCMTWVTGADGAKIAFKDVPVWKVTKICEILGEPQESEVRNDESKN